MADTVTLVTEVQGPKGKAEVFEEPETFPGGGQRFTYSVVFNGQKQTFKSMGEAYIVAGELSGTPT